MKKTNFTKLLKILKNVQDVLPDPGLCAGVPSLHHAHHVRLVPGVIAGVVTVRFLASFSLSTISQALPRERADVLS